MEGYGVYSTDMHLFGRGRLLAWFIGMADAKDFQGRALIATEIKPTDIGVLREVKEETSEPWHCEFKAKDNSCRLINADFTCTLNSAHTCVKYDEHMKAQNQKNITSEVNKIGEPGHTTNIKVKQENDQEPTELESINLPNREQWLKLNPLRAFMAEHMWSMIAVKSATGIKTPRLIALLTGVEEPMGNEYVALAKLMKVGYAKLTDDWGEWFTLTPDDF